MRREGWVQRGVETAASTVDECESRSYRCRCFSRSYAAR